MGELAIRRNRGTAPAWRQEVDRTEAKPAAGESRAASGKTGLTVSETLQRLLTRVGQAEDHARQSHRTLQAGEVALAEVRGSLDRLAELAREAAGGGASDRDALQARLEDLRQEIDRMLGSASAGGTRLFLDEEAQDASDALAAALGEDPQSAALPDWLLNGISQDALSAEDILSALGLDKNASGLDLLAAIAGSSPESNSAVGRLAALYLGAIIAAQGAPDAADAGQAMEGLRQLMEKIAEGFTPDQAVALLTNGAFAGVSDFQLQFTGGTIPGLQDFLVDLLLTDGGSALLADSSLLALLSGGGGGGELDLALMMDLLGAVQSPQGAPEPSAAGGAEKAAATAGTGDASASDSAAAVRFGGLQVTGRDLSGVSFDESAGQLTVSGGADVTVRGAEGGARAILAAGSGAVTLRDVTVSHLTASASARIFCQGETAAEEVRLGPGASLTLGGGTARIGVLRGEDGSTLRLTDGAAAVVGQDGQDGGAPEALTVPVVLEGAASLAARAAVVTSPSGKQLDPFDVVWKALLPGWSRLTAMSVDGRQARLELSLQESVRLWLDRGDPSHGSPIHTVILRGRDSFGRPRTRYAYLHWNQQAGAFEEISMYPNPFTVTGGEAGRDWVYEEETQTLRILSDQVTAISGGPGTDARREPFSGRIALADRTGAVELLLGGVSCRVARGGAFSLGRENDVTLILPGGVRNVFESGPGCAGISLGDGCALRIGCSRPPDGDRTPAGALVARGTGGGAGIGRDCGAGRDQTGSILILGGAITASGDGGGAGIGSGRRGAMGSITVRGGTLEVSGGGGGAGIGGAPGGPAGDITIQGGKIAATALCHAAAIGAGVQGACGDVLVTGSAQIVKALGGDPGADIGGCLFGGCGKVQISGAADIGGARLWTRPGVRLRMGEDEVTLPQFRLSSRAMGLDRLSLATREAARAALPVIEADRRWTAQIQEAYSALYSRLERSLHGLSGIQRYIDLVRNAEDAGALLEFTRQSIPLPSAQAARAHGRRGTEDLERLLR